MTSSEFDAVYQDLFQVKQTLHDGKYFCIEKVKVQHRWEILKTIQPKQRTNPVCKESLQREFEIGSQLQHPSICSYFRYSPKEFSLYREYFDGLPWNDFFKSYPSEVSKIGYYLLQLFDALVYMHAKGIYHMDLKSDNILISLELRSLKIIDFGHAVYQNDTLWRGGYKAEKNFDKLISEAQDWDSFFSLVTEIKGSFFNSYLPRIKRLKNEFIENDYRPNFQDIRKVLAGENSYHKNIKLLGMVGFIVLIILYFNFFNVINQGSTSTTLDKDSLLRDTPIIKKIPQVLPNKYNKSSGLVVKNKSKRNISFQDSLFLVNCARQFGPEFQKECLIIDNSISKYECLNQLLDSYEERFGNYAITQNMDSLKKTFAKRIYDYQLSLSFNKYVHLLK